MKHMNPDLSSAQTNALFQRIDQDENHCISFIEFLAAALDPKDVDLNEMKQVRVQYFLLWTLSIYCHDIILYFWSYVVSYMCG